MFEVPMDLRKAVLDLLKCLCLSSSPRGDCVIVVSFSEAYFVRNLEDNTFLCSSFCQVATFKSPGMWVLSPDAQKAFSEGRIMNSTSPETVASDSPALNIESPPLPAPPHSETEASGPAKVETRVESTSKEGSPDDGGAKAGDLREARDLRERGGNALGASGREESEKEVVERVKEGKEQPGPGQGESTEEGEKGRETKEVEKGRETKEGQKGRESKDRNEAGRESSSSESDSGSESESDSSSGSSGSSSSEDEAEDEGADKGEMQSAEANPQREASAKENGAKGNVDTLAGQREERNHDTEESERGVETKTGVLGGLRNVDEKEGKTGVDKGAQNGSMGAEGTAGSRKDTAFKPAIEVERIDDDDEDRMGNGAGRPEKAPQAEVQGIAGDSGRKRKESEGTEGVAKRRKTEIEEQGSERRGEEKPKAVSKVGGASRKENQKSVGGLSQKALAEGEKKKTEKSGLKAGARVDLSAANDGAEKKKPKAPTEADRGKIGGVNGRDGGVNAHDGGGDERKASHAAAGPSLSDDVRNSSALSKFKAAQDLIAERKANRKAIPIELTDQTALDRRKGVKEGVKEGVKRPPSGPSRGVSKVVKGVVKGLPGSKPGGVPSRKGGENGKSSVPLARVRIERLDDGSESGPRAGSPKSGEKRRHGEEATEGAEKPRNEGVAGAKEFSGAAKDVKKGLSARKDDFGNSPLEDGELAPAAKKVKLSQNGGVDKGGMMVGKEAASERVTKPGSAKVVKPTSESGGKSKADSGVKPKPNAAKAEVKSGLNQGSTPALVKKPPQKTPGKAADGTGTKGPKKPGESRGVSANGVTNKAPGVKPAQNGGQKKAPSEPPKKSQSAAANGKVVNGKAGAQNGVVKRPAETKPVNGTRGMTEEDWVRYADAQPVLEDRTVGSLEE